MPNQKCNTGRIIVNKNIQKIGELANKNYLFSTSFSGSSSSDMGRYVIDKKGKIIERKKKGRLYSLGGNEPPRKQNQLMRLKTVGTFDLCMEVTALACGIGDNLLSDNIIPRTVATTTTATASTVVSTSTVSSSSNCTPSISKIHTNKKSVSSDHTPNVSATATPSNRHISSSVSSLKLEDSLKIIKPKEKKSRSLSTSSYLINEEYLSSLSTNLKKVDVDSETSSKPDKSESILNEKDESVVQKSQTNLDEIEFNKGMAASTARRRTLKKCDRIVRTDSELFKDNIIAQANNIVENSSKKSSKSNSFEDKEPKIKLIDSIEGEDQLIQIAVSTEESSRNISTDTVFSDSVDPIDLDQLEREYKEHLKSNLQREYKSDGDSLDEVGKKRYQFGKWKNQSIDFNFLDDDDDVVEDKTADNDNTTNIDDENIYDDNVDETDGAAMQSEDDVDAETVDVEEYAYKQQKLEEFIVKKIPEEKTKLRKDDESRTKSEGDKDYLCDLESEQRDSFDTQESTEEEPSYKQHKRKSLDPHDEIEKVPESATPSKYSENHPITLFEKRFGKFKKMNKLLKVKRFSTSALYDRKKSDPKPIPPNPAQQKAASASAQSDSKQDLSSSKISLQSPKSLKNKKFLFKKRKFSFFGKSQSNNDLNLNLKSLASKISLISKSNFDISGKISSSNCKLNNVGVTGKYSASNEYRSDILTSPLSEAFYNATGSYQLSAMELFEKFCSQDFTGLYKNETNIEPIEEQETPDEPQYQPSENNNNSNNNNWAYKGAIKKCSLRKATLLKQNSEPKFCLKNVHLEEYAGYKNFRSTYYNEEDEDEDEGPQRFQIQEGEEFPEEVEEEEQEYPDSEYYVYENSRTHERRKSSFSRQFEFEQPDEYEEEEYYEDQEGQFYISGGEGAYRNPGMDSEVDEIYLMPDKHRFAEALNEECEDDIIIIDDIDELEEDEEGEAEAEAENHATLFISNEGSHVDLRKEYESKDKVLSLYAICPKDEELSESSSRRSDDESKVLKNIISDYVKNALTNEQNLPRTKSVELLSNSSETMITNSNSEFDTVKQLNLDSCSTSKLSLSLKSDIFDDFTLAPPDTIVKTLKLNEIDDFTITPDGSLAEKYDNGTLSEQDIIKNELHSQYTIIDFDDELENDDSDMTKYTDDKSSFADALNKEFDKLFTKAKHQTSTDEMYDTDVSATTPSIATTVVTAIKIPSRCSMEKLEPYSIDSRILDLEKDVEDDNKNQKETVNNKKLSQSMTSTCESLAIKHDDNTTSAKSKRSHSLGNIQKRKSNKCTPL